MLIWRGSVYFQGFTTSWTSRRSTACVCLSPAPSGPSVPPRPGTLRQTSVCRGPAPSMASPRFTLSWWERWGLRSTPQSNHNPGCIGKSSRNWGFLSKWFVFNVSVLPPPLRPGFPLPALPRNHLCWLRPRRRHNRWANASTLMNVYSCHVTSLLCNWLLCSVVVACCIFRLADKPGALPCLHSFTCLNNFDNINSNTSELRATLGLIPELVQ